MQHSIISSSDDHPYEIVEVKLIAESPSDRASIDAVDEQVENYLTFKLNAVSVLKSSPPVFVVKRAKDNLGIG